MSNPRNFMPREWTLKMKKNLKIMNMNKKKAGMYYQNMELRSIRSGPK